MSERRQLPWLPIFECALHTECTTSSSPAAQSSRAASLVRACATCPDHTVLRRKPEPTDAPVQIHAHINGTRNLIYHIWPTRLGDTSNPVPARRDRAAFLPSWKWNVRQLIQRIDLFNGVRTIGVATDPNTATLEEVQAEFAGVRIDHWIERPNVPQTGEGVTFLDMMRTLPVDDSVTFYGHAKGVKYAPDHEHYQPARQWADMLYRATLDYPGLVETALRVHPITGPFKRYSDFAIPNNNRWHYSGTFFWFRNRETFSRPMWSYIEPKFYGCIETWPANVYTSIEAACLFGDDAGFLYVQPDLDVQQKALDEQARIFTAPKAATTGSGVSNESFMAGEIERGFTTWNWLPLVALHTRGVRYIRDQLKCHTLLEIGSGLGMALLAANQLGLDATGSDINPLERDFAISKGVRPDQYQIARIDQIQIQEPVDCIYSVEVFEHCTDSELDPICRQLAANCRWFYFTSTPNATTPEADAAWGHVNLKSRERWIQFFAAYNLTFDHADTSVTDWGLVFRGTKVVSSAAGAKLSVVRSEPRRYAALTTDN